MLKKLEKKRERNVISEHRQSLIQQLNESTEAALTLHLAVLLLFQANHNEMIQASGKFVPQLISFLRPVLEPNTFALLHNYQELVIKQLTTKDNDERDSIEKQLQEMMPKIKEIAVLLPKKQTSE
jgi:4-hydroxy-3-methylbut-2-enyl diphosphate reductase IspH